MVRIHEDSTDCLCPDCGHFGLQSIEIMYKETKDKLMACAVIIVIILAALCYHVYHQARESPVMTEAEFKTSETLAKKLDVTQQEAEEIEKEAAKSIPAASYYVQADTIQEAAETTARQIEKIDAGIPKSAAENTGRPAVGANQTEQKVDVYKLNRRNNHKIKAGMTVIGSHAYSSVGYQAGRWEADFHFSGLNMKGGSVMYTVKEW